jgi:hypothetical protein
VRWSAVSAHQAANFHRLDESPEKRTRPDKTGHGPPRLRFETKAQPDCDYGNAPEHSLPARSPTGDYAEQVMDIDRFTHPQGAMSPDRLANIAAG